MKTSEFYKLYNLKEMEVISICPNNGDLSITVHVETHSDYVANGFRTDFDFSLNHRFTFVGVKMNHSFHHPRVVGYKYENNYLYINIDDKEIMIPDVEVDVVTEEV